MFFQDGPATSDWGDLALYAGVPPRAFESELGMQCPVGFWDPAGFTAVGIVKHVARKRLT